MAANPDPDNPIPGLLGDLLKVIGSTQGATAWLDAARALAVGVATDGATEPNVDPLERIRLEELARVVELHAEEVTGVSLAGRAGTLVPVGRGSWAQRALEAWRPLLEPAVARLAASPPAVLGDEGALPEGLGPLLSQFASAMGPILVGLQFGSAAGHLARQALGQYALLVPWPPGSELLVVPENIWAFADDWSLSRDGALVWVCAHELTARVVLDRPGVTERLLELLDAAMAESLAAQQGLAERLGGAGPDALQQLLAAPEALLEELLTPGSRAVSERLSALVAALGGYIDHATARIAEAVTGPSGPLAEAWYRHRAGDSQGRQAAATLFGFDAGRGQVDRGAAFVRGVLERAGEAGLARLLEGGRALPTPAEVDAPGLWLERLDLPEDPEGAST